MKSSNIVITGVVLAAVSFAVGRYTAGGPEVKTTVKTAKEVEKDKNVKKTVTTVKLPDGTVKIVEVTDTNVSTKTKESSSSKVEVKKASKLNISALIALDTSKRLVLQPIYGISVSKEVLGPITAGVFGLTNGTVGLSIGINF